MKDCVGVLVVRRVRGYMVWLVVFVCLFVCITFCISFVSLCARRFKSE